MSVQSIDITCSQCQFNGSTGISNGRYKYETPDGLVDCNRGLGWCSDCKGLAPIEVFPTEAGVEMRKTRLKNEMKNLAKAEQADAAAQSGWKKALGFSPRAAMETRILRENCSFMSREIEEQERQIKKTEGGRRVPRCLRCGSKSVFVMPRMPAGLDRERADSQQPIAIGLSHPGCGGELLASYSPIRLNMRFKTRIYSQEGTFLRDED